MEKNIFLLINEIVYHIHTCKDLEELKATILSQIKFIIPYTYSSLLAVTIDPDTKAIHHSDPYCLPHSFTELEEAWITMDSQDESFWLSHAPESVVVRSSEIMGEETREASTIYGQLYRQYNIYDTLTMNLAYDHHVMALLTFYRTRADGPFTDQEAFYLRTLSNHINYAYYTKRKEAQEGRTQSKSLEELTALYDLTRREEEILGLIFQEKNNEEILARLGVSRNTLLKHLQNLYRKCGVSSRWDLLKLRG